jgi:hypothetical protein
LTKDELLKWYYSIQSNKMPKYIEASDVNCQQLLIDGKWKNIFYSWTLLFDGNIWKFAETDSDRGYVFYYEEFNTEFSAVEYAKNILNIQYLANK